MAKPPARTTARRDLEIDEDRRFQERMWRAERLAWIGFALVVVVALLGLTGQGGPLQRAALRGETGEIDYPRVTRWEASDEIRLTLEGGPGRAQAVVETDRRFSETFEIEDIQPAPADAVATPEGQRLTFDLQPGRSGSVTVHVRAMRPSLGAATRVHIDGEPFTVAPVILP